MFIQKQTVSEDQYLNAVREKFMDPETQTLLKYGQNFSQKVTPLRNSIGMADTFDMVMSSARNAFRATGGRVALSDMIANFSEGPGYSDVSDVRTVGAIDVTLISLSQSLIPYTCLDRALPTPAATIYYNNIIANNEAGNVQKGDIVSGNFVPPNTKVRLGPKSVTTPSVEFAAADTTYTADLGEYVSTGTVKVTVTNGTDTFVGQDFAKNGTIYFSGTPVTASVDYESGVVTLKGLVAGQSFTASASLDGTKDTTGKNILKVIPDWVPTTLESYPQDIILQNSIPNMMFMSKVNTLANGTATSPYNDVLYQRVKNAYIDSINATVIEELVKDSAAADIQIDISTYGTNSFSNTKNDLVSQLISNMRAKLLQRTNCPITAILVNSNGAAMLENIPIQFTPSPNIFAGINGLIGYYLGVPVYRHNALDGQIGFYNPGANAEFIGLFKNADNTSGSLVFGEFLPFTSTGVCQNYNAPTMTATGYFSQVGIKKISNSLIVRGQIITPSGLFTSL